MADMECAGWKGKKKIREIILEEYRQGVEALKNLELFDYSALERLGLSIQCITIVKNDSEPRLHCYLAGQGIFYEFIPDEGYYDWLKVSRDENGTILVPGIDQEDGSEPEDLILTPNYADRDFREYDVFENIEWCLRNIRLNNDWFDEVQAKADGIDVHIRITFICRLLNENTDFDETFFDGTLDDYEKGTDEKTDQD